MKTLNQETGSCQKGKDKDLKTEIVLQYRCSSLNLGINICLVECVPQGSVLVAASQGLNLTCGHLLHVTPPPLSIFLLLFIYYPLKVKKKPQKY